MSHPTTKALAWAAGLLEGEGSFNVQNQTSGGYIRVQMAMTDQDVVARLTSILGGRMYGPYDKGNGDKLVWQWATHGHAAAGVMMTVYPMMGERRRTAIQTALAHWRAQPTLSGEHRVSCKNGHLWSEHGRVRSKDAKYNAGRRYCAECARLSTQRRRAAGGR